MEYGYWGFKGLGEISRQVAAYLGLPLTEYNPQSREEWATKKSTIGADFPNLPYLKDGDYVVTESQAIPAYLALKANRGDLLGEGIKEQTQIRTLDGVLQDIRIALFKAIFAPTDKKEETAKLFEQGSSVYNKLTQISEFLGTKDFLLGHLTLADFHLAFIIETVALIALSFDVVSPLSTLVNLRTHWTRVSNLEGVKEFAAARAAVPIIPAAFAGFDFKTVADLKAHHTITTIA